MVTACGQTNRQCMDMDEAKPARREKHPTAGGASRDKRRSSSTSSSRVAGGVVPGGSTHGICSLHTAHGTLHSTWMLVVPRAWRQGVRTGRWRTGRLFEKRGQGDDRYLEGGDWGVGGWPPRAPGLQGL